MRPGRPARAPEITMLPMSVLLLGFLVVYGDASLLPKHQQRALLVAMDGSQTGMRNQIQQQQHQPTRGARLAALINDANLDQQWYGAASGWAPVGPQSKRARKMSAFMPMRGRKDGRDAEFIDQMSAYRENDAEPTIMRLVSAGSGPAFLGGGPIQGVGVEDRLQWMGPRQFVNQLALHNQQANLENVYDVGGDRLDSGPQMMHAKLRRAFHPMRGKKSNTEPLSEAETLALVEELGV